MNNVLKTAFYSMVLLGSGCASMQKPKGWSQVELQMPQGEVAQILGEPKTIFPGRGEMAKGVLSSFTLKDDYWPQRVVMLGGLTFDKIVNPTHTYYQGWEYPPRFTRSTIESYYVYFNQAGEVIRLSDPNDYDRRPWVTSKDLQ